MTDYDYIVIGHVTIDVREGTGGRRPGGTALYAGLQAARLGSRTLVITAGVPAEIEALLAPFAAEFDLSIQPRAQTTTFATSGTGLERRQRRVAWAGEMDDPGELGASIVHVAPVAQETAAVRAARSGFVGLTPQGLLRSWGGDGEPSHIELDRSRVPPHYDALVLDELERTYCADTVDVAAAAGVVVAVTAADDGVAVETVESCAVLPALRPTALVDDLGAGDVFAAAFFVALNEGLAPVPAAQFGQAAACIRLAGAGPAAVAERAAIALMLA